MKEELVYWLALSQLRNWKTENINKLIITVIHENKIKLSDFFNFDIPDLKVKFGLNEKEINDIISIKKDLPSYSFMVEDLISQGYEIITIDSPKYSKTLKENLKIKYSPPVLYVKGNTQLMQENSIAIVGSRDADEISLLFTDNVAKSASKDFKVIVSGFAKGVDKQALDSAIKYKGQSIIVLPQGIMTFNSGFNKYYQEIQTGDVLVLSTFYPKAPWSVQLAMARNPIIYGLAKEIYVAQSSEKGGTWAGVIDGLRKGRKIFVRLPENGEKNANPILIEKGGKPVDMEGNLITTTDIVDEKSQETKSLEDQILELLSKSPLSSTDIIKTLKLDWKTNKMTSYIKRIKNVNIISGSPLKFSLFDQVSQGSLF